MSQALKLTHCADPWVPVSPGDDRQIGGPLGTRRDEAYTKRYEVTKMTACATNYNPTSVPDPGSIPQCPAEGYVRPTVERLSLEDVVRYEGGSAPDGFGNFIPI